MASLYSPKRCLRDSRSSSLSLSLIIKNQVLSDIALRLTRSYFDYFNLINGTESTECFNLTYFKTLGFINGNIRPRVFELYLYKRFGLKNILFCVAWVVPLVLAQF